MRIRKKNIFFGIDWLLILLYFVLIFFGWNNIYSATVNEEAVNLINFSTEYGKQLIWIGLSFPIIILILFFDAKFYEKYASLIYLVGLSSLVGLFIIGKNINGATSWYDFGGFSLQPSEFVKAATALAIAKLVSDKQFNLKKWNTQIQSFLILFFPAILITLQPDPGSALVYTAFIFVLYREGLPIYYITIGFVAIFLFIVTLYFGYVNVILGSFAFLIIILLYFNFYRKKALKKGWIRILGIYLISFLFITSVDFVFNKVFEQRHRDRFDILLGKTKDIKSIGYNTNQSVTTIASGGITGKGFLEGERTQGDFVPEQQTDYIFTTVGEEWGFIGSSIVVVIFILFLLRIIHIAERQKTKFSRVYGYSITAIFFTHFAINIGMVLGLLPTIGIPLPFFSYGGSALWGFTVLLFIFIRLDANRSNEW
ncbi:MAG: rod shape-determining protein RodA [Lutibacter sp.]|uniref:rod shape-determining protein RodA n=1 Tax=Lutibacter sp. TaxID=1925666 RepID=UPI0017F9DE48|nr:rod shape-determining protein RodA [Lutibacter sp.]MBT8316368.1 rod shape-determining protein RodA [Lutibacter sp.]NNJ57228.1 rod shape-determining protein RodA [Lutibacter sp.]